MFGTLRLVLAAIVAFTHTVPCPPEFESGVFAVVVFFLLSGYAMTGLIHTRFREKGSAAAFYLERLLRIAPQYYFWLAVSCYLSFRLLWAPVKSEGFLPYGLIAYLTILPLGLQGYIEPIRTLVLAQASSLGVEICFYIVTPWLVRSRSWTWIGAILCLGVFVETVDGTFPAALYTYYTIPGPLLLFILGSMAYRRQWKSIAALGAALLIILIRGISQPYNLETAVGLVVGLIAIGSLSRLPARRWDTALGNASYGCFLAHGCVNAVYFQYVGQYFNAQELRIKIWAIPISCLVGYVSYLAVERPTLRLRKSVGRRRPNVPSVQPAMLVGDRSDAPIAAAPASGLSPV